MIRQVIADLSDRLGEVRDPPSRSALGPVATRSAEDTLAGMEELKACAEVVYGGGRGELVGVEDGKPPNLSYALLRQGSKTPMRFTPVSLRSIRDAHALWIQHRRTL